MLRYVLEKNTIEKNTPKEDTIEHDIPASSTVNQPTSEPFVEKSMPESSEVPGTPALKNAVLNSPANSMDEATKARIERIRRDDALQQVNNMDRAVVEAMERIRTEDAIHNANMRRRAETGQQDFEHRRLMLGLERFHEFEVGSMRRRFAAPAKPAENGTNSSAGGMNVDVKRLNGVKPGEAESGPRLLFKQISEDGQDLPEPLHLRVVWVDSDNGGFFRWEKQAPSSSRKNGEEGSRGDGKVNGRGKMKEVWYGNKTDEDTIE